MGKWNTKIIAGTVAVTAVLGAGVATAAAAGPPNPVAGNGAQATHVARANGTTDRLQTRARDGTGPRHDQTRTGTQQHLQLRDGTGPNCPYRS